MLNNLEKKIVWLEDKAKRLEAEVKVLKEKLRKYCIRSIQYCDRCNGYSMQLADGDCACRCSSGPESSEAAEVAGMMKEKEK